MDDTCKFIIPGTERYHPRNKQFDRLYWDEYVAYQEHQLTCHGCRSESELLEWARLKRWLDNNPKIHGCTGEHKPDLADHGIDLQFSWRGWGDMMASYMNSKVGKRKYDYIYFYMGSKNDICGVSLRDV